MNNATALQNIIAVTPVPMAIVDTHLSYTAVSGQWLSLFNLENETIIGRSHYDFFPHLDERWKAVFERCLIGGTERFDGWEITNWLDETGKVGGLVFCCDESGSKVVKTSELKEHLYQSEAQFNQAFEHSLIGMAIINPEGRWEKINQSLSEILGYNDAELAGHHVREITHEEDLKSNSDLLTALASGEIKTVRVQKRYIHKNGTPIWVIVAATMLKDSKGQPLHFITQIEDITQRKAAEEKLILSEKKYRSIFENVQDVFYQTDEHGIIREISPSIEKYAGYARQSVLNKPVSDFYYHPEDRESMLNILYDKGVVSDFEVRLKTKDDILVYTSVNAHLVIENGMVKGIEGSLRDITTRKIQENALKQLNTELTASNELKNELLSIIGHDLRNPISGSLQLLNLTLMDFKSNSAEELHMYLLQMKQELSNANNLLEDLLAWAKVQFKSINLNQVEINDLSLHIEKAIQTTRPMADKKQISISLEVNQDLKLYADAGMLDAIIRNLLTNAIKFTKEGGKIKVKAVKTDFGVQFSINDTGIGMSPSQMARLFNKAQNYTTYGTAGEKGTGLGLNLSHEFALKHGGDLWVESEPGVGSTFYFTIPQLSA